MKKLEDLKKEILNNQINNFYVFYGEDYGIRKHYIDKIGTFFPEVVHLSSCSDVTKLTMAKSLFVIKQLLVVYNDIDFAKESESFIQTFIDRLKDYTCILVYEQSLDNSTLFKKFSDYITYFPAVQDNVAKEFVKSELQLLSDSEDELAYDCNNLYNNILLESNKVQQYAIAKNMSQQNAYESLYNQGQLLIKYEDFSSNVFMNDILLGNFSNVAYWTNIIQTTPDRFFISLTSIFTDYLIAYLIKRYGKWDGSSRAYNYGLSWGRAKLIREFSIPYSCEYLLDCADKVASIDSLVKSGKLLREHAIDYYISLII